jgi:hypothetical protein
MSPATVRALATREAFFMAMDTCRDLGLWLIPTSALLVLESSGALENRYPFWSGLVGLGGIAPPTSALSESQHEQIPWSQGYEGCGSYAQTSRLEYLA